MKKKIVRNAKAKQVKKNLPKKSIKKSSKWQFVIAALALVTVGYLVFKNAVQKSDINMIAPPAFEPAPCGVSDLQLSVSCGENMFKSAEIKCADGVTTTENTATSCRTAEAWYKEASVKCSNKCMATPTPSATPIPSNCKTLESTCAKPVCPSGVKCDAQPSCGTVLVCETQSSAVPSRSPANSPVASVVPSPVPSSIPSIPPSPRPSQLK